ncbi:hypothetical protein CEE69_06615 [Rhodopirellula bahusiensis]|uniref:Uncharacterized protein n=1 Tax=Rhodopirellula bahusiensis TaxID=2014065 RepID=A0A2G1WA41_9BACT|nr:hypothetical protein CEE69_06615 [Rhodopirellula bahusiensis]
MPPSGCYRIGPAGRIDGSSLSVFFMRTPHCDGRIWRGYILFRRPGKTEFSPHPDRFEGVPMVFLRN